MDKKWLIAAAAITAIFSTEAQAEWYAAIPGAQEVCPQVNADLDPVEVYKSQFGDGNVTTDIMVNGYDGARLLNITVNAHGKMLFFSFVNSRESCIKALPFVAETHRQMAAILAESEARGDNREPSSEFVVAPPPKPVISDRLKRIQDAEERGWQLALGNGRCVPMNVTGYETPHALAAQFPSYPGQTVIVEFQSKTQATMTDLTGRNEPTVFILGKKACVEATH